MSIQILNNNSDLKTINNILDKKKIKILIEKILDIENKKLGEINIILQSDKEEIKINRKYLKHNYYTDVIAFQYNKKDFINGDIFISTESVKKNAYRYNVNFNNELLRVIIHGILHLIGYNDKNEDEIKVMKEKENNYLKLLQ